jgi:alanine dehydrogenase
MAVQAGAYYLEKPHGGLGMLLGGVPGVDPAKVVILGGGVVGSHACHIALGMGAECGCSTAASMCCVRCGGSSAGRSTPCSRRTTPSRIT